MEEECLVLLVPYPAQGHLNQLLHLSLKLSQLGLPTHYASSGSHIRRAKSRIQGWNTISLENIHFHHLPLHHFPTPPPDPTSKYPNHIAPLYEAAMELRSPLSSLFRSLSANCRRLVVIHDMLMSFVGADVAELANGESYRFQCVPAYMELQFFWFKDLPDHIKPTREALDVITTPFEGCVSPEFWELFNRKHVDSATETGTLFNTCRALEGEFLDIIAQVPRYRGKKIFAVGPINPLAIERRPQHECLDWLDEQPVGSVIYVSFGSTCTFTEEQIEQLGAGLHRSGQRFIWVLRDADRVFVENDGNGQEKELPVGFEGMGMVVRGWAPQLHILAHPSTGGFMSHCGWNSCMESLSMGVPIIAWPVHSDQPRNAFAVTEYLKTGVAVREWAQIEKVVSSVEIEESIKKLTVDESGKEIKKRARLLGETIRLSAAEGGSSRADFDSFVAHIIR